jgi:hypothetical protein
MLSTTPAGYIYMDCSKNKPTIIKPTISVSSDYKQHSLGTSKLRKLPYMYVFYFRHWVYISSNCMHISCRSVGKDTGTVEKKRKTMQAAKHSLHQ